MSVSTGPRPAALAWDPRPVAARTTVLSAAALALAAGTGLLAPGPAVAAGPAVLVAAGLLGLPHGAVDHLALGWARGRPGAARPGVLALYATAAAGVAALALAAPVPAVLALLVLSAAHFAEGEAAFDRLRGGGGPALPAAALGTAVVALPLLLHPVQVRPVLAALSPDLPGAVARSAPVVLAVTAALVVAGLAVAVRSRSWQVAAELALVVVAALLAPALLVFAVWFAGWHAPRHLVRLAALEPDGDGPARGRRLVVGASAPTAVAVAGLVGLTLLLGGLPGAVLVVLLALTVPHAAVVARLDALRPAAPALSARGTPAGPTG